MTIVHELQLKGIFQDVFESCGKLWILQSIDAERELCRQCSNSLNMGGIEGISDWDSTFPKLAPSKLQSSLMSTQPVSEVSQRMESPDAVSTGPSTWPRMQTFIARDPTKPCLYSEVVVQGVNGPGSLECETTTVKSEDNACEKTVPSAGKSSISPSQKKKGVRQRLRRQKKRAGKQMVGQAESEKDAVESDEDQDLSVEEKQISSDSLKLQYIEALSSLVQRLGRSMDEQEMCEDILALIEIAVDRVQPDSLVFERAPYLQVISDSYMSRYCSLSVEFFFQEWSLWEFVI